MFQLDVRLSGKCGTTLSKTCGSEMPNNPPFRKVSGSICGAEGFRVGAVFCDIKTLGTGKGSDKGRKPDLALIVSDVPAAVAGMFTTNRVCAAPVKLSAKCAARKTARAIVVNSGNANACTGAQGMRDAKRMAQITAEAVAAINDRRDKRFAPNDVLVCSTGRIGVQRRRGEHVFTLDQVVGHFHDPVEPLDTGSRAHQQRRQLVGLGPGQFYEFSVTQYHYCTLATLRFPTSLLQ